MSKHSPKMAIIANSLAFTGSSYLFLRLSKDSTDKERKRHDLATEKLQNRPNRMGTEKTTTN